MDLFKNVFGRGQAAESGGETTSLLSDWKSYQTTQPDVEAGRSTEGLFGAAADNARAKAATAASLITGGLSKVQQTVTNLPSALPTAESFSIPSGQQLIYFFSFLAAGAVFLVLAFMIFLPVLVLSPSKFALSFTLGCLCIMAGFSALRGVKQQLSHMTSKERLPFSAAYFGSIFATLYVSLWMHSYLLSLICSALQFIALLYYTLSYFPGGAEGVRFLLSMGGSGVMRLAGSVMGR